MTKQHPIVPSPKQVDQWFDDAVRFNGIPKYYIARHAAQWGADQLRAALRPKPPGLKQQALAALNVIEDKMLGPTTEEKLIRKVLESLDD